MKMQQENQNTSDPDNKIVDSKKSELRFFRLAALLILIGIILVFGFWVKSQREASIEEQRLAQIVQDAVARTMTQAAIQPAASQTAAAKTAVPVTSTNNEMTLTTGLGSPTGSPAKPTSAQSSELCSPIEGVKIEELQTIISQPYNVPNQSSDMGHHGVDLGSYNFNGKYLFEIPVRAILPGRVIGITINRPPIGNVVILETRYDEIPSFLREFLEMEPGFSLYHFYGHLVNEPTFETGTRFGCGDQIDLLGKSQTVEAHLHLETRIGKSGLTIGQMAFYTTATTEDERAEYLRWRTSGEFIAVDPMSIFLTYLDQK